MKFNEAPQCNEGHVRHPGHVASRSSAHRRPGNNSYPVHERISVVSVFDIPNLDNRVEETASG